MIPPGKVYVPHVIVGKPAKLSVKVCKKCHLRGYVTEAISYEHYFRRRYVCKCGHRWTTYEAMAEDVV